MLLYIHIPFCDSKCHYCAFNSFTSNHHLKEAYTEALLRQLRFELDRFGVQRLDTIYIGGGTPSTMSIQNYERIFTLLEPYMDETKEITVEANPTASREWIRQMRTFANRISFGVQSFDDRKLRFLGRSHSAKEAVKSIESAAKAGFRRINLDLIYDCACDTPDLLAHDIDLALSLPIDHISAYALTIEEKTPFAHRPEVKSDNPDLAYFVQERIQSRLPWYEVSNFGTPSLHNMGYWQLRNYIGAGCGAVGFFQNRRFYPPSDLRSYIANPLRIRHERLDPEDLRTERIFLGLRSCVGVEESLLDTDRIQILIQEGKIVQKDGRIFATNYFLADEIALFLL